MLSPLLSNKHQLGFRLFRGETLNSLANAVNQIGQSGNPVNAALTTVGNGTITAAQLQSGIISRSGPTGAFTDTTDTGTALDTALGQSAITGVSWEFTYINTTNFTATIAGGTGITASGILTIPANTFGTFLLTRTGTGTYTLVGLIVERQTFNGANSFIATADNGTTQTLTPAMITGGLLTYHVSTGGTTPSLTLPLATDLDAALPNAVVGSAYTLRIINRNSGTATVVTNTGWTTSGTLTLATNTWRDFVATKTAAGAWTITAVGTGTDS